MPIYAYKCESCGHAKDALQKMSDTPLSVCPRCGASTFKKQLTSAGFQLKGSGWYVTDFRGGNQGEPAAKSTDAPATDTSSAAAEPSGKSDSASTASGPPAAVPKTSPTSTPTAAVATGTTPKTPI